MAYEMAKNREWYRQWIYTKTDKFVMMIGISGLGDCFEMISTALLSSRGTRDLLILYQMI